jgi:ubiquinone/menaquinone biosynthesis C-methylase UbiE
MILSRSVLRRCLSGISSSHVRNMAGRSGFSSSSGDKADFGFKEVSADEKESLVRNVFSSVANKYDIMNDFMSFGTHRLWKDEFVNMIGFEDAAKADPNYLPRHLDVAGGTGDIAFRSTVEISKHYNRRIEEMRKFSELSDESERPVVVFDINPEMLEVGKSRAAKLVGADTDLVIILAFPLCSFVDLSLIL